MPHPLDTVVDAALAAQRIVGAILLVHRRGELVYHRAAGLADREAARPMREDTPHRLASMTKPFTSVAALALVGRGVLALEQPVTRWLPDFAPRLDPTAHRVGGAARLGEADTCRDRAPAITIQQLLTHTSGLGYRFLELPGSAYHAAQISDGLDQPGLALDENLRRLAGVPLLHAPGSAFHYSLSTDVLGAVIERAADAPLPDAIARLVTGPLELASLGFAPPREPLATPYRDGRPPIRIRDDEPVPLFGPFAVALAPSRALDPRSYPSGGAGMYGTAADLARFFEALRTRAIPTVPRALLDAMMRDQIAPLESELLGPGYGWGLGVSILRDPSAAGSPLGAGAARWGGAYGHSWFIDPASETSSVLLTNTAFEGMNGALRDEVERAAVQGAGAVR
jgi:CubicO group peptidase (beta-lactamase class C family)